MPVATIEKVERNPYEVAMENFEIAADALEVEDDLRSMIRYPERILTVSLPVRMDTACSTAPRAAQRKVGSATIPMLRWMK
jgi:hypothetical protein